MAFNFIPFYKMLVDDRAVSGGKDKIMAFLEWLM